jgi:hypothetical protein
MHAVQKGDFILLKVLSYIFLRSLQKVLQIIFDFTYESCFAVGVMHLIFFWKPFLCLKIFYHLEPRNGKFL